MYIVVWEFRVRNEATQTFVERYGSAGDWAKFFGSAEGFVGTELARSMKAPQVFYTLDAWKSKTSYDDFLAGFADEYNALDKSFERLTEHERLIGTMTSDQAQMPASERGASKWRRRSLTVRSRT